MAPRCFSKQTHSLLPFPLLLKSLYLSFHIFSAPPPCPSRQVSPLFKVSASPCLIVITPPQINNCSPHVFSVFLFCLACFPLLCFLHPSSLISLLVWFRETADSSSCNAWKRSETTVLTTKCSTTIPSSAHSAAFQHIVRILTKAPVPLSKEIHEDKAWMKKSLFSLASGLNVNHLLNGVSWLQHSHLKAYTLSFLPVRALMLHLNHSKNKKELNWLYLQRLFGIIYNLSVTWYLNTYISICTMYICLFDTDVLVAFTTSS